MKRKLMGFTYRDLKPTYRISQLNQGLVEYVLMLKTETGTATTEFRKNYRPNILKKYKNYGIESMVFSF